MNSKNGGRRKRVASNPNSEWGCVTNVTVCRKVQLGFPLNSNLHGGYTMLVGLGSGSSPVPDSRKIYAQVDFRKLGRCHHPC